MTRRAYSSPRSDRAHRDRPGQRSRLIDGDGDAIMSNSSQNFQRKHDPDVRRAQKGGGRRGRRGRRGKVGGGGGARGGGGGGGSNHRRCKLKMHLNPGAPRSFLRSDLKPDDLEHLKDGNDLPPPTGSDVETPTTIPQCKDSDVCTDGIKEFIQQFLQQYYSIYDSGDRQPLLGAYHDGASFSLTTPYSTQMMQQQVLKHTRQNVVAFLNELPKTQHDMASFTVAVNTCTNTLLSFTVSGVFKEVAVDGKARDTTMAFSRAFITVPAENSGLRITNDQLSIPMATEEIPRASVAPAPTPSSTSVPTLTALQQEMLAVFSQKAGMKLEWSQQCLQENQWDFHRAAQDFTHLKTEGKIPDEAFTE